jgi:outer membrane receptor protein involved in Fe transport
MGTDTGRIGPARIILPALLAGCVSAGYACGVHAQTVSTESGDALEEIVIIGSRIAVPNDVAISPVMTVSAGVIEQAGITRIEDLLNSMPQVFASQGSTVSNGADGTATVNLRGLGPGRTLVLVNGRRLGPGDPAGGSQSDLNEVPAALIERVDILTGGASSVYGADAVAGVVNFKLLDRFEGLKVTGNYGLYNHSNDNAQGVIDALTAWNATNGANYAVAPSSVNTGATKDLNVVGGLNTSDGKGNATFYATYRDSAAVLQSQYSYSACALLSGYLTGPNANGGKFQCGGSPTSYPGSFWAVDLAQGQLIGIEQTIGPNNALIPFTNANLYNYGPTNYFQRPDTRYTAGAFLHYEFSEHLTAYSETQFMNDRTLAQIAPSGAFFGSALYNVNCDNPELSPSMVDAWCGGSAAGNTFLLIGRRNVESGNRKDDLEHRSWRVVVGARGSIDSAWQYDVSGQYSNVRSSEALSNDLSITRINNALSVVDYNAATGVVGPGGVPTCTSALPASFSGMYPAAGTDARCVPWNIFQLGGANAAAASYLNIPLWSDGTATQQILGANLTGDLAQYGIRVPTAAGAVKVNLGAEWRKVKSTYHTSPGYQSGDAAGVGTPVLPVAGAIDSREAFAEVYAPLLSNRQLAKSLNVNLGYRFSSYGAGFNTNTYKYGLEWAPVSDLRLRASWSRAVRVPNVGERFSAQSLSAGFATDPCAGPTPLYSSLECQRTGVSLTQYGNLEPSPSGYNAVAGGNPQLRPETATTVSFGVGWNLPVPGDARLQVDYYDIRILSVIRTINASVILQQCASVGLFCDLIHRDRFGSLWLTPQGYVVDTLANVGELEQQGVDVDFSYAAHVGAYGSVRASVIGTYILADATLPVQAVSASRYDCTGYFGPYCGPPTFKLRTTSRITWETPWRKLEFSLAWRYFDPVAFDALSGDPNIAAAEGFGVPNTDARLSSRSYFDVTSALRLGDRVTVRLGVNNMFDKDPPIVGNYGAAANGNTFPQIYDALGRYMFATIAARF